MEQGEGKGSGKAKYIWDPEKLAWIETRETPPQEERAEIVEAEGQEGNGLEHTLEETESVEAGVELGALQYRGVWVRLGAALVDLIILMIASAIISYILTHVYQAPPNYYLLICGFLYYVGFWSWRGQTPGKMLLRARVVRKDGSPVDVVRAIARYVFYLAPLFGPITFFARIEVGTWAIIVLPMISLVLEGFTREKRGIHDFVAGTVVVDARGPIGQPAEVVSAEADQPDAGGTDTADHG